MPKTVMVKLKPEKLSEEMTERVLSLSQVANKSGLSAGTIGRAMAGHPISAISARLIARALGKSVFDLVSNKNV